MSAAGIVAASLAGVALGAFFYGGLWLTVARLNTTRHPAILALASFWMRSLAVLLGVVFFARQGWQLGLIVIPGFAAGRLAISFFLRERRAAVKCT